MTCKEAPAALAFTGYIVRTYRRVTTEGGELRLRNGKADEIVVTPDREAWAAWWSSLDTIKAWAWAEDYGRLIKDGAPWRLALAHRGRALAVHGNGAEEYAPPGFRRFCLALDELAAGQLLDDDDRRSLARGFQLEISIEMDAPRPLWRIDQHPTKQALDRVLVGAQLRANTFPGERVGWIWTAADPDVLRAAVGVLATSPADPEARLLDLTSGVTEQLWPAKR